MHRRLGLVLVLLLLVAMPLWSLGEDLAPPHGRVGFSWFTDGLETTVMSPSAALGALLPGDVDVEVMWTADVISSASVDVVSAATTHMEDTRHQVGLRVAREALAPGFNLTVGADYSFENDSDAIMAQVSASQSFLEENLTLGLSYGLTYNRLGLLDEPSEMWRGAWMHGAELQLGGFLDRYTIASIVYATFYADGYQANPYRRVPISLNPNLVGAHWVEEQVPETRWRNSISVRLQRALGRVFAAMGEYRFYVDDWGITSHTQVAELTFFIVDPFTLGLRERFATQDGASFYRQQYQFEREFRTRDRRLSPHQAITGGAFALIEIPAFGYGSVVLRVGFDVVAWNYEEYVAPVLTQLGGAEVEPLGWVTGTVFSFGVEVQP